ncbi:GbsR/MarR family transcriptional regulator [Roseococcus suduntuyensis]|uniref:HTH-type transcriptional regulator n=1 Tax=Roseococcus suduntuyensis TaxID=455361 RepID=A0A840AE04_9PROT|nr:GbsR/MarR family transcriptional regulator [Roseococcus suduntuyensis]MBB3898305.1 DNA-binding transcriptional regulator GbsR (MarR family) [Roseococcus suduntuyensis]
MDLPPSTAAFVLHFGEMGSRWGINRTVGQIYALLFLSDRPLPADEIAQSLGFSRSNVSMGLKELENWRLIKLQHLPGDRREHFTTPDDVWAIVRTLAEERRKREVDPTLTLLRDTLMQTPRSDAERHAHKRMESLHEVISLLTGWMDDVQKLPDERLVALLKLGGRVARVLEATDRFHEIVTRKPRRKAQEG